MILTGTDFNIRSDSMENQRLHGSGLYNESRAEHFLKLYNRKPIVAKGSSVTEPSEQQQDEITLRVDAEKPRRRIANKTIENSKRAVSGRSTQGIDRDRKKSQKQSFAILKANTKRQMLDNQNLL
jgi:hypothetical protein